MYNAGFQPAYTFRGDKYGTWRRRLGIASGSNDFGFLVMVLYGYWDKITGKEYYVDADILAYDEDLIEELKKEGKA